LLEKGANMAARDDQGDTPLSLAAKDGDTDIVALLNEVMGKRHPRR